MTNEEILEGLKSIGTNIIGKDINLIKGFAEGQLKAIAIQTELVSTGILAGTITDATKDFFLNSLKDMVTNLIRAMIELAEITIEKLINAFIEFIRKTIETIAGTSLKLV